MRNLKRVLSLAMAALMLMGMMVVSAGAASTYDSFTDKDEIVNTEAVNTIVSLGVMGGKPGADGTLIYDPAATVKRGEMAKIIAVALNGGKEPVLGDSTNIPKFSDVPTTHWAYNYIAYCVQLGIIAGHGDGTFAPEAPVTGSQAAKMFLCALGYRADLEGLTGAEWELNTNILANQEAKLYDGLESIKASEGLNRDNTAQMAYNAIQAQEVRYDNLEGSYEDVLQTTPKGTMLHNRFGVDKVEGVVVANDIMAIDNAGTTVAGKTRLSDVYINGTHRVETVVNAAGEVVETVLVNQIYPVAMDNSYLGQRVVLYVKGLKDLAPNAASTEVISEPIISNDNTVATTASRLGDTDAVRSFLANNGLSLPANYNTNTGVNGTVEYTKLETQYGNIPTRDFAVTSTTNVNGTELTFIDHSGDGVVDYIFKTIPTMAKVTAYSETNEELTIAGEGAIDFADIANEADVAKDDIVLYYLMNDTYYLSQVETVSGKVESYDNSNKTVSIDGTSYGKSTAGLTLSGTDLTPFTASEEFIGNTYTFYLDGHGNVVGWVLGEETLGNYALIIGTEGDPSNVMSTGKVKLMLADGTTATYDVNLLASANRLGGYTGNNSKKEFDLATDLNKTRGTAGTLVDRLVTYSVGEDKTVTLTDPTAVVGSNYAKLVDGVGGVAAPTAGADPVMRSNADYTFTGTNGKTVTVNDSTLFFINNGNDDPTVVQGLSNLPVDAMDSAKVGDDNGAQVKAVLYTTTESNKNIAKAVFVDGYYAGTKNFVYVSKEYVAAQPLTTGETIYTYPVVFADGETGTIQVKGRLAVDEVNNTTKAIAKGNVYEYTMNGSYAELTLSADTFNGMVTTWARGNAVNVLPGVYGATNGTDPDSNASSFTVATDAQIWNVEDTTNVTKETLSMDMSVVYALNADGLIVAAFVRDTDVDFCKVVNDTGASQTFYVSNTNGHGGENDVVVANGAHIWVANGFSAQIADGTAGGVVTYDVTYENTSKNETNQTANIVTQSPAVNGHNTLAAVSVPANSVVTIKKVGGILPASAAPTISAATAGTPSNELGGQVGTVAATGNGTLTYEWFKADDAAGTNPVSLKDNADYEGATTATLSVKAGILNNTTPYYFYCVVTNTEDGKGANSVETDVITVTPAALAATDSIPAAGATAAQVNEKLEKLAANGTLEVRGNFNPTEEIVVPDGKTLNVTGSFNPAVMPKIGAGSTLTVGGNCTLEGDLIDNEGTIDVAKNCELSGNFFGDLNVTGTLTLTGDLYVEGTVTADVVVLNGHDLSGSGITEISTGTLVLGSSISGDLTINAEAAVIKADFTMTGGTLNITGDITKNATGTVTLTVSGGTLDVTGTVGADNMVISGDAAVTADTVSSNVTIESSSTGSVNLGNLEGSLENNSDNEIIYEVPEITVEFQTHELFSGSQGVVVDGSTNFFTSGGSGAVTKTQLASAGEGGQYTVYFKVAKSDVPSFDTITSVVNGGKANPWAVSSDTSNVDGAGWFGSSDTHYFFKWGGTFATKDAEENWVKNGDGTFEWVLTFSKDGKNVATDTITVDLSGYTINNEA